MADPTVTPGTLEHELVIALTRFGVDSRAQAEHLAVKLAPWIRSEATALLQNPTAGRPDPRDVPELRGVMSVLQEMAEHVAAQKPKED